MGKTSKDQSGPQVAAKTGVGPGTAKAASSPKPPAQTLDGYVKGGVVHLLEGDLPDGTFVKVIRL
jgi:probable phosphoglycerate mutase